MDKCSTGPTGRGVRGVLWAVGHYDGLFWTLVYLRMEICIHAKQTGGFFIHVVRQGDFSIISSGCGSGSNRTVWMPWCATQISSVQSCTDMSTWHPALELASLSRAAGGFAQSFQENAALLTVHTPSGSHPASLGGLGEVLGLPEFWEGPIFFIFSRWSLAFFSFLISFCRFCCFSGFSPAVWGYWRQGKSL